MTDLPLSCVFSDLYSGYGEKKILRGVTGELRPGTVTALIGPNGGGKSTLLRALAGFLPYEGGVSLAGSELKRFSRRDLGRAVGFLPQQPDARGAFTVCDVIRLGRLPWQPLLSPHSRRDDEIVREAAERLGVTPLLFRSVTELSGGERQRVFLAMIAAQDAPVCLLDEPTSAMDPRQSLRAFGFIRELSERGKTVAVAAHDLNAALSAADFYLAIRDGKILASGSADEIGADVLEALYDTPFSAYLSPRGDKVWYPYARFF